jgi:hypothetical protein
MGNYPAALGPAQLCRPAPEPKEDTMDKLLYLAAAALVLGLVLSLLP